MNQERLDALQSSLGKLGRPHTPADVAVAMRGLGLVVSDHALLDAMDALRRHSIGAGPLEHLLRMTDVTDVVVNGVDGVYIDRGQGLERTDLVMFDDEQVRRLAIRLASAAGRRLDDSQPFVDGRLEDGTRLHAVLAPVASPGTCISLRVPAPARLTLRQLLEQGTLQPEAHEVLAGLIMHASLGRRAGRSSPSRRRRWQPAPSPPRTSPGQPMNRRGRRGGPPPPASRRRPPRRAGAP